MKRQRIVYIDIPKELDSNNLTDLWNRIYYKVQQTYTRDKITSNYTGDGTLENSDLVVFIYEFRDYKSYEIDESRCKNLGKSYRYFKGCYSPS